MTVTVLITVAAMLCLLIALVSAICIPLCYLAATMMLVGLILKRPSTGPAPRWYSMQVVIMLFLLPPGTAIAAIVGTKLLAQAAV